MDQIKIGKFISSCRKEQGMTQAALAEKLGISDRAVSKWETGKSIPDYAAELSVPEQARQCQLCDTGGFFIIMFPIRIHQCTMKQLD